MSIPLKLQYKIGNIEFLAEGAPDDVEQQRKIFVEGVLPSAVEAMARTQSPMHFQSSNDSIQPVSLLEKEPVALIEVPVESSDNKFDRISLAEYIRQLGVIAETDFVLAAAYFSEKKNGNKSFTTANVKQWYSDARRSETSKVSGFVTYLAKKGLIMDDPESLGQNPKCYIITTSGLEYIKNFKPKEKSKAEKSGAAKSKKAKTKPESQYEHLAIDDLHLEKYPAITKLKETKDKVSMVMYVVSKENQGEWFTVNDLLLLLNKKLGDSLTDAQIHGVFRHHPRWFYSEKSSTGKELRYKLQNEGITNAEEIIQDKCE